jgi:hypothetical protein
MRSIVLLACAAALVACAGSEKPSADSAAAATPAPAPAPATLSLADLAGKWTQKVRAENSDSVLVTAEVVATPDPSGWTIALPGRPVMPVRITVAGDSLLVATGPYESVLRKGVQVTTSGVMRLQDGKLVGITTAHYAGATGADSVARLRTEMTRTP